MADRPRVPLTPKTKQAFQKARRPTAPRVSDRAIVREVLPEIRRKLAAGWSYEEVRAEMARTLGFGGTRRTLYNYVWQLTLPEKHPLRSSEGSRAGTAIPDGAPAEPPQPRRSVRETLRGSKARPPTNERSGQKSKRPSLVEILNRPV